MLSIADWRHLGYSWDFSYLFAPVDEEISKLGWDVYVHVRVPFHVLPKLYVEALSSRFFFSVVNVTLLFLVKNVNVKNLSLYILTTVLISLTGILIYLFGDQSLLRFYLFRHNDAIQPFLTILMLGSILSNHSMDFNKLLKIKMNANKLLSILILLVVVILFIQDKKSNLKEFFNPESYRIATIETKSGSDSKMAEWIRNNAADDATFIVPIEWETFYIDANRALFVSWKHAPQKADDLVEWYDRIQMINRGQDLFRKNMDHKKVVESNYRQLAKAELLQIQESYPSVTHVIFPTNYFLDFPELFRTNKYVLYKL